MFAGIRSKRLGFLILGLALMGLGPIRARALAPDRLLTQCRLDTWGIKDGLPLRDITALAQTADGHVWIGTPVGLFRFDGSTFDRFDPANTPGLTSERITALTVNRRGNLLIGTERGGFGELAQGVFRPIGKVDSNWNITNVLAEAPDGTIWQGGNGSAVGMRVHGNDTKVIAGSDPVTALVPAPGGGAVFGLGSNGLQDADAAGVIRADPRQQKLPTLDIRCLMQARDGALWCGTDHNGVFRLLGSRVTAFTTKEGLSSDGVRTLCEDGSGRIFIGTTNGVSCYDGKRISTFTRTDGLPDPDVHAMMIDCEGALWVAAGTQLCHFSDTKLVPYTISDGTAIVTIFGTLAAADGGLWCATEKGLHRLHQGVDKTFEYDPAWPSAPIIGVVRGEGNSILACTRGRGEIRIVRVPDTAGPAGKQAASAPIVVKIRGFGARIVGERAGEFLGVTERGWFRFRDPAHIRYSGACDFGYIFSAHQDPRGDTWVSSVKGLFKIAGDRAQRIEIPAGEGGTAANQSQSVIDCDPEDADNILFVMESQIGRIHNGKVRLYGVRDGLPSGYPFQITRDRSSHVWVGDDSGIYRIGGGELDAYDRHIIPSLTARRFRAYDGIPAFPIDKLSAVRTTGGSLWFAGRSGITRVDPESLGEYSSPPPVTIESASIDTVALPASGERLTIKPGPGSFTARFAALSYVAPEDIRIQYMLEGFDERWVEAGDHRLVTYNSLPPGSYRFRIIASNADGFWNERGVSVAFDLQPHFYQMLWFRSLIASALLGGVIAFFLARARRMARRAHDLERQVSRRTSELQSAYNQLQGIKDELVAHNDVLGASQVMLKTQQEQLLATQEELAAANERLVELATTDGLTGLKNHRSFHERLAEEWELHCRSGSDLSLIMLDIDHFKQFNDTFGHPVGDLVLQGVAATLQAQSRPFDVCARYGGEELVVIAPHTDMASALALAERMRTAIQDAYWPYRQVTASFGVSTSVRGGSGGAENRDTGNGGDSARAATAHSWSDLIHEADAALYYSKRQGRNRVTHAWETMAERMVSMHVEA